MNNPARVPKAPAQEPSRCFSESLMANSSGFNDVNGNLPIVYFRVFVVAAASRLETTNAS
jgi:hypothetical protein